MRRWVPTVEGFEVSGFVSRGILVDAAEAPQFLVVVPQFVVEGSISTMVCAQGPKLGRMGPGGCSRRPGARPRFRGREPALKRERMGVAAGMKGQNPRPFGSAQGRLCRKNRDKGGAAGILEPRNLRALVWGQPQWGCGSQLYPVPSFVLSAIEGLIGRLDDLLGLAVAGAGLGHSDADGHR